MLIDEVKLTVNAGKGGDGMISFRREKYIPMGGPSGGNGGRGASVFFRATTHLNTLLPFRYQKKIDAPEGNPGEIKNMYGRGAEDIYIDVPVGTVVTDLERNRIICDLYEDGMTHLIAKGGRGGRGNVAFKTQFNKAPKVAENGAPGETKQLKLELKLIADVGLIGFPNAGKSTLLTVLTNAKPEIGNFEFTTKEPMLGVVSYHEHTLVLTDLPGLIEGASHGRGLGLRFLKHIERCRILLHVIDLTNEEDPVERYMKIQNELKLYGKSVYSLPQIIIGNKLEDEDGEKKLKGLKTRLKNKTVIGVSALTHEGLDRLQAAIVKLLAKTPSKPGIFVDPKDVLNVTYNEDEEKFFITRPSSHVFVISGEYIERHYKMANLSFDEGIMRFNKFIRSLGIEKKLVEMGIEDGDLVRILDYEFEYYE